MNLMRPTPPPTVPLGRRERFSWSVGLSDGPGISAAMMDRLSAIFRGDMPAGEPKLLGSIDIEASNSPAVCSFLLLPDGENQAAQVRLYAWSDGVVTWVPHRAR